MEEELKCLMNKTISDFENNIHYKDDLKYIKIKFIEVFKEYNKYIKKLNKQIIKLKNEVNLEKEIKQRIDIKCPYCKNKIWINNDVNVCEIICPRCQNIIEIGWK